jgi:carbon-monoxide dehydrogenase small subunit
MERVPITVHVNGREVRREVEPRTFLVQLLRDDLGLTGTKIGCDTSQCGACTVHMDGLAVKACTVLAAQADGAEIATIEGLANGELHPLQQAFWDLHGLQCGYCTPGMIMTAVKLIEEGGELTDEAIRHGLEGNLCRCTGYQNIVTAIKAAAAEMRGD